MRQYSHACLCLENDTFSLCNPVPMHYALHYYTPIQDFAIKGGSYSSGPDSHRSLATNQRKLTMRTQLYIAVCVLISAGLATAQIYHIPAVSLDTPDNSVCPPDAQLETVRNSISGNLSDILVEIAANKTTIPETTITIPECGGSGWRRVAFLNMTDPDQTCPSSWRLYSQDSVRACGRQETDTASCDSVQFSPDGYEYTQVCGRIIGYQYATPEGLVDSRNPNYITLTPGYEVKFAYVDGVSVTYGSPRQHIWTLYGEYKPDRCCGAVDTLLPFNENSSFWPFFKSYSQ